MVEDVKRRNDSHSTVGIWKREHLARKDSRMPDKTIYIYENGKPSGDSIELAPGNVVTWKPLPARGREVLIRFVKKPPFSDWGKSTGMSGRSVSGTVVVYVGRSSHTYKATNRPTRSVSTRGNPKLIVDGGGGPGRKPKARKGTATKRARAAKK